MENKTKCFNTFKNVCVGVPHLQPLAWHDFHLSVSFPNGSPDYLLYSYVFMFLMLLFLFSFTLCITAAALVAAAAESGSGSARAQKRVLSCVARSLHITLHSCECAKKEKKRKSDVMFVSLAALPDVARWRYCLFVCFCYYYNVRLCCCCCRSSYCASATTTTQKKTGNWRSSFSSIVAVKQLPNLRNCRLFHCLFLFGQKIIARISQLDFFVYVYCVAAKFIEESTATI